MSTHATIALLFLQRDRGNLAGLQQPVREEYLAAQRELRSKGIILETRSPLGAYRTLRQQAALHRRMGRRAAPATESAPHVSGRALDLFSPTGRRHDRVISEVMTRHGFVRPTATRYGLNEPWHWEFPVADAEPPPDLPGLFLDPVVAKGGSQTPGTIPEPSEESSSLAEALPKTARSAAPAPAPPSAPRAPGALIEV